MTIDEYAREKLRVVIEDFYIKVSEEEQKRLLEAKNEIAADNICRRIIGDHL